MAAPPGWYVDPAGGGGRRWWDGSQWAAAADSSQRRSWILESPVALRIDQALVAVDALLVAVAVVVVLFGLVAGRPLPDAVLLLVAGVPVLFAGQLWTILVLQGRSPRPARGFRRGLSRQLAMGRGPSRLFGHNLPKMLSMGVVAVGLLGWIALMTGILSLTSGSPEQHVDGCRFGLDNHGTVTCVSQATYLRAQAREAQIAGGAAMFFFSMQGGVAASEVYRRRRGGSDAGAGGGGSGDWGGEGGDWGGAAGSPRSATW